MDWKKAALIRRYWPVVLLVFALLVNKFSPSRQIAKDVDDVAETIIKDETGLKIDIDGDDCGDDEPSSK